MTWFWKILWVFIGLSAVTDFYLLITDASYEPTRSSMIVNEAFVALTALFFLIGWWRSGDV